MNEMTTKPTGDMTTTADPEYGTQAERWVQPRATIFSKPEEVVLELEMPGVARDKIDVTVEKDELTVTGWRTVEDLGQFEILHQERNPANFRRSFVLSDTVDAQRIAASLDNGVLRLALPKAESAKPKRIEIA